MRPAIHFSLGAIDKRADLTQYATRTLDFLNSIEKTLKSVTEEVDLIQALTAGCLRQTTRILALVPSKPLDPALRVDELLVKSAGSAARSYEEAIRYRDSARADRNLHHEDGVVECYEGLVAALADFHNCLEELREAVGTHDALLSPVVGKTYTGVDEMFADIHSPSWMRFSVTGFQRTARFDTELLAAPPDIAAAAKDALKLLLANPSANSLRRHTLPEFGRPTLSKIDVLPNHSWQISFEMDGTVAILRRLATHKVMHRSTR